MASNLPRCTEPGCPFRWRTGPDRPCTDHHHDAGTVYSRYTELMAPPGDDTNGGNTAGQDPVSLTR